MSDEKKVRFTLELSPDADAMLDRMASLMGGSRSEAMRRALLLLGITIEERLKGNKFAVTDADMKLLREVVVL